ncbi:hypothetical protein WKK05_20845 [Nostoc sp. UHCC 0302]
MQVVQSPGSAVTAGAATDYWEQSRFMEVQQAIAQEPLAKPICLQ